MFGVVTYSILLNDYLDTGIISIVYLQSLISSEMMKYYHSSVGNYCCPIYIYRQFLLNILSHFPIFSKLLWIISIRISIVFVKAIHYY